MKFKLGRDIFFLSSGKQRTYCELKTPLSLPNDEAFTLYYTKKECALHSYIPLNPPCFKYLNYGTPKKKPPKCSKHRIKLRGI